MLLQIKNRTCILKIVHARSRLLTNMKHEWDDGCKAKSHGSDQVLITHTARAGLFIFNLHRYVFYFQFAVQLFSLHVLFLICSNVLNLHVWPFWATVEFSTIHRIHKWWTRGKKLVPSYESEALEGKQKLQIKTFSELAECLARIPPKMTLYGLLFKYNYVGCLLLLIFSIDLLLAIKRDAYILI